MAGTAGAGAAAAHGAMVPLHTHSLLSSAPLARLGLAAAAGRHAVDLRFAAGGCRGALGRRASPCRTMSFFQNAGLGKLGRGGRLRAYPRARPARAMRARDGCSRATVRGTHPGAPRAGAAVHGGVCKASVHLHRRVTV